MIFGFLKVTVLRFGVISTELALGSWCAFFIRGYSGLFWFYPYFTRDWKM